MMQDVAAKLRQILMIAYYYPPVDNSGVRRTLKFAKYLPQSGYQPLVLTTRGRGALPDDAETRTFRIDDPIGLLKRAYRAYKLRNVAPEQRASVPAFGADSRIERWRAALSIPDHQIIWHPAAVRLGMRLLRSHPVQMLFSTSPPETDHLIALSLKRKTGLPWVADFRDGWLFEPLIPQRNTLALRRHIEARLERSVVLNADHVVTANAVVAGDLRRRYPQAAGKISVITNGYDPDDFAGIERVPQPGGTFRLVHTGTIALSRWNSSIDGLLTALKGLQATQPDLIRQLEIVQVGNLSAAEVAAIEQSGLRENFTLVGSVPYRQALHYQVNADVLLLVVTAQSVGHSSNKLYEYLATGRPILALGARESVLGLVPELGAGLLVAPDDVYGIQRAIQTFYGQWKAGLLPTRVSPGARQFDRRALTRRLAQIFDSLLP